MTVYDNIRWYLYTKCLQYVKIYDQNETVEYQYDVKNFKNIPEDILKVDSIDHKYIDLEHTLIIIANMTHMFI